jgi:hypothetical protein
VFVRTADGSASDTPSPVWSGLTTGTSGDASGAGLLAYIGIAPILDGTVQSSDLAAQTTTSVIPAFTTATDKSVVIGVCMKLLESSGQTSTVATFTERADNSTTSGTGHVIEVSDKFVASHGSSGTATVTWSATTSARALAVSLGLMAAVPTDFECDWAPAGLARIGIAASAVILAASTALAAQNALNVGQDDAFPPPAAVSAPAAFGLWSPPARPDPADPIVSYQFTGDEIVPQPASISIADDDPPTFPPAAQPWLYTRPWFADDALTVVHEDQGAVPYVAPTILWTWRQPWFSSEEWPTPPAVVTTDDGISTIPPPPQLSTANLGIPPWINSVDQIPVATIIVGAAGSFQQPPKVPLSVPVVQYRFTGDGIPVTIPTTLVAAAGSFQQPPNVPLSAPVVQYRFSGDERIPPVQILTDDDPWVSGVAPEWGITTLPMPWSWDINDDLPVPPTPVVTDDAPWVSGVAPDWGVTTIPLPGSWESEAWVPQRFLTADEVGWAPPLPPQPQNVVPRPWHDGQESYPHTFVQLDDLGWIPPLPQKLGNLYPNPWDGAEERPHITAIAVDDLGWYPPVIQPARNGPIYLWLEEIPAGQLHGLMEDEGTSTVVPPFNLQTNYGRNIVPIPSQWDDPGKLPTPVHISDPGDVEALLRLASRLARAAERPFIYQISQEDTFEIAPRFVPWPTQVILPPSGTTITLPASASGVTLPDSTTMATVPASATTVTVSHFNV